MLKQPCSNCWWQNHLTLCKRNMQIPHWSILLLELKISKAHNQCKIRSNPFNLIKSPFSPSCCRCLFLCSRKAPSALVPPGWERFPVVGGELSSPLPTLRGFDTKPLKLCLAAELCPAVPLFGCSSSSRKGPRGLSGVTWVVFTCLRGRTPCPRHSFSSPLCLGKRESELTWSVSKINVDFLFSLCFPARTCGCFSCLFWYFPGNWSWVPAGYGFSGDLLCLCKTAVPGKVQEGN